MPFDSLGLAPEYVRVVADEGYTEPTPVQREAIPLVLAGRDLLAGAQTGTGKTAAFVLPLLQRLHASGPADTRGTPADTRGTPADTRGTPADTRGTPAEAGQARGARASDPRETRRPVRALVLAPTRELALQVEQSVRTYGRHRPIRSVAIYGGVGFEPQVRALRAGPGIVVATPGRLLDHVGQRTIDLSRVEILVLDEADRMLDMGFIRDIRRVLAELPAARQNLLFSATFSDEIRALAEGLLDRPATVDVAPRNVAAELVDQVVITVDRHRKHELLTHLVRSRRIEQALVFTRTKHGANRLAEQLERDGIRASAIHGNKSQSQRVRALEDFKRGSVGILVATDIAARGIDIDALPHVVNYELPMVASDYIHRIGRTGRAGVGGRAVSLACVDEAGLVRDIERLLRRALPTEVVAGFEPDRSLRAEPIRLRTGPQARPAPSRRQGPAPARRPGPEPWARPGSPVRAGRGGDRPATTGARAPFHGARPADPGRRRPAPDHRPLVALPGERLSRAATGTGPERTGASPTRGGIR